MLNAKIENNVVVFDINISNRPMNVISDEFVGALEKIVDQYFVTENQYAGFIFQSSRPEFIVGADLDLLRTIKTVDECLAMTARLQRCFRLIERCKKPSVACIAGAALGGGLEFALACHSIIALDDGRVKLGFPEVTLGLLPGGGGTQRLPRMIGYEAAVPLLVQGNSISAKKAKEAGIVQQLAGNPGELLTLAFDFIQKNPVVMKSWDQEKFKLPGSPVHSPRGYQFFPVSAAMLMDKTWLNYPAPLNILKCVYEGLQVSFDQGLLIEQQYFAELVVSPIAKNMLKTLFYSIGDCKKGKSRPALPPTKIEKIGIIGAGMMGAGIAYVSAKAGIQVILKDIKLEAAETGKAYSEKLLSKAVSQGYGTETEKTAVLGRITATTSMELMEGCDLIIEAVIEDRKIKKSVIEDAERVVSEKCIFASNTSTLPITGLAEYSKRRQNFIGLHFFSPVDKMGLVEIIVGKNTGDEALALCMDYVSAIGKTPIVVNDSRGFYTSRVFTTYITEGINALVEGIPPGLIENAGKACGMAVGPLTVADEVSLDLIQHISKQTVEDEGVDAVDPNTYRVANQFVNELGRLGRKAGKGFFDYPADGKKFLSPELAKLFPVTQKDYPLEEMKLRLLTRQAVETLRCREEGVLRSGEEADVGSILGWGFPAYTGGTASYIDFRGRAQFIEDCRSLERKFGARFKLPASFHA
jgi:3-hydroxyacyl-CoA dehydrogenase/enoyl-CoA hydratase/3-hydroxybutyryl-CoA epimerase